LSDASLYGKDLTSTDLPNFFTWQFSDIRATYLDVVWLAVSVIIAAVCNLPRVLRQVWPHIFLLGLFGGFVAWNGGVVLGKLLLKRRTSLRGSLV
jgi:hypothetical protein